MDIDREREREIEKREEPAAEEERGSFWTLSGCQDFRLLCTLSPPSLSSASLHCKHRLAHAPREIQRMDSLTHTRRVEQRWRRAKHTAPYMEQTLTLNSVSHKNPATRAIFAHLVMAPSSFTLGISWLPHCYFFFGLFVAPVVAFWAAYSG